MNNRDNTLKGCVVMIKNQITSICLAELGEGDSLTIYNITREKAGIYECVANNMVPPASTNAIHVNVECE